MGKGLDPATVRDIKALVKSWKATQRLAVDQARTPQMPYSSITGSIPVYDDDGNVAARLGRQDDGSYAPTVTLGPVPPQPSPPVVSDKNVGQASITWDGHWLDDVPAPLDHARMEVHLTRDPETAPDEEQSSSTRWASIVDPAGGTAAVSLDAGTWFARLVARSQADRTSEPSEPVEFEVKSVLDRDEIVDIVEAAGGGFSLISATTPPPDPDPDADLRREGDMWWQRHPGPAGAMFAAWRWESGAWVEQPLTTEVFDFVNAAHIRGDLVQAMRIIGEGFIIAGDPDGAHAAMTADGFRVSRVNEEGVQYTSIRLGSGSDESLEIIKVPGEPPVASISSDGQFSAQSGAFAGDVTIAGQPLVGRILDPTSDAGLLDRLPRGLVRKSSLASLASAHTWPADVESAVAWFQFDAYGNREYRFEMPWDGVANPVGSASLTRLTFRIYQTIADATGTSAVEPTKSDTALIEGSTYRPATGGGWADALAFNWTPWTSESDLDPRSVGLMLTVRPFNTTFTASASRETAWQATVTDIGPSDDSVITEASAPGAASQRRFTTTWVASNSRAYDGRGDMIGGPNITKLMRQGWAALGGSTLDWHGSAHSMAVFDAPSPAGYDNGTIGEPGVGMSTALNGAVISKIEVYLYVTSWRRPGNNEVWLRAWDRGSSLPATHPPSHGEHMVQWSGNGTGKWVTIDPTWMDGQNRAIQIGLAAGPNAVLDNGSCNLAGASFGDTTTYRPKVRVTYTKAV